MTATTEATQGAPFDPLDARGNFTEWLAREMPPGTIIGDPRWWAPKVIRAFHDYRTLAQPAGEAVVFGWWLVDCNGIGRFSRHATDLTDYQTTPGYSATPLYTAPPVAAGDARDAALAELTAACEAEFCCPDTEEHEPDDSMVSHPEDRCHITFGMIRRARAALTQEQPK